MKPLILSMLIVGSLAASSAFAEPRSHERDGGWRQQQQQQRIQQGRQSGDTNRNEYRRLEAEQRHIRQERRQYAADGHVDRRERADLRRDLNRADRHIYNERHDRNRRDWNGQRDNGRHNGGINGRHVGWDNDRGHAASQGRRVDRTQWQQREMIERGLSSGRLTQAEFRQLRGEQRAIRAEERSYRSDGRLSGTERADLRQDQAAAWRNIRTEMNDGQRQNYYGR